MYIFIVLCDITTANVFCFFLFIYFLLACYNSCQNNRVARITCHAELIYLQLTFFLNNHISAETQSGRAKMLQNEWKLNFKLHSRKSHCCEMWYIGLIYPEFLRNSTKGFRDIRLNVQWGLHARGTTRNTPNFHWFLHISMVIVYDKLI